MASSDPNHRRYNTNPQSIPLQDLSPPLEHEGQYATGGAQRHRRTLSDRGRNLLRQTHSIASGNWTPHYAPVAETSPSPSRGDTRGGARPALNTSFPNGLGGTRAEEDGGYSPLEDAAGFQAAMGFAGLSFQGESSESPPIPTPLSSPRSGQSYTPQERDPYISSRHTSEDRSYFPPTVYEEDTAPLTDERNLQPISGANPITPTRHDRSSFQSVRFLSPGVHTPISRTGEDLGYVEAGTGRPRKRSLSPGAAESPLHRAGTIMRNMSQRVVNISNEPEVAERTMRRKSSLKHARLHEPPSFPALTAYSHDGPPSPASPIEKPQSPVASFPSPAPWQRQLNPLRGKTLGVFPPDSKLRLKLCDLLVHPVTEPLLLMLIIVQTVLLAVESSQNVFEHPRSTKWGSNWIDAALLVLFTIYTIEIIIRVIVSGFIVNPVEYSTINRKIGLRDAVLSKTRQIFTPHRRLSVKNVETSPDPQQPSVLRTFTAAQMGQAHPGDARQQARVRLAYRAYLRHSFNRTDFLAVVSFWIAFFIGVFGVESKKHVFIFRMLSCLRIIRLLNLTSGTSVILRSLKKAAPLLVNVAFLISFFWLLFAIIGVQSFRSSFRRHCVWIDPLDKSEFVNLEQYCGGYLDENGNAQPYLTGGRFGKKADTSKGFLCPQGSLCIEGENPANGTKSFDNIFHSLELVFVVMSSNTYSDLLYTVADSDYLAGALFFAAGIVILSLWLINLLIAVITSSFQVIREESKASAFTGEEMVEEDADGAPKRPLSTIKRLFDKTSWIWVFVIAYGLICQSLRSAAMSSRRRHFIDISETGVTLALLFEIILRFTVDWRHFFKGKRNLVDLMIAIVTTVIQIPAVKESHRGQAYAWLTIFQIIRIYRVVLAVPMTRDLIMIVLGNVSGLLNLILFVFLLVFLAAIFASQLFRGELPNKDRDGVTIQISFFTIYNSFLGMYQILSSENWTAIMYNVTSFQNKFNTAWIGAAFCILWFVFANFIVLNMFIAVIQENFDVSEDEKRLQQVKAFLQRKEHGIGSNYGNLSLSSIFKLGTAMGQRKDPLDYGSAAAEMLLKDAIVRDFLNESDLNSPNGDEPRPGIKPSRTTMGKQMYMSIWTRIKNRIVHRDPNPFYAPLDFGRAYEELDPRRMAKEVVSATERRKKAQREYLRKHPSYNVSLFLFKPNNPIRKICQRIVGPGRGGDRIEGVAPSVPVWYAFSAFIYAAIIAMVLLACVTTPLYQKDYFKTHQFSVKNWFVFTDMGFALLFSVEAIIKVIADGFFWTPNAYFRGSWGFIDGVVLVTLWVNVAASLYNEGQITRTVGAFKALRALRLLNISDSARDHFHSVILRGGWKIISAAFVSLSLLIPFAIYGLNLFVGKLQACNDLDSGIRNLTDCVDEYRSQPYAWDVLAPRKVSNPYYDFDNFGNSAFILFQIVSQEGWTDVSWAAQSITGVFTQPRDFASQGNAIFFVVFNLLGAVFVLTLFVSVFMRNYTEQTGVAFLTTDQRSWLELRKLLRQVSPSKRPSSTKKRETWEEWCYRRAVRKTGRWQRFITGVLILHVVLLCLEWYPDNRKWELARDYIFLVFTVLFIANIIIRILGLSWHRFRKSSWDVFSLFSISGTFVTSILLLTPVQVFQDRLYVQLHKLFLVSIALLLIPRNNQLDQLFKTAAASLTAIGNLLMTWFVLFLVYAIALTQTFGLTRFNGTNSGNLNFRDVPKALILLFRTSTGEGWNQIMEDFATVTPPYCTVGERYFDGDCGSPEWARALFISWNILSMYIFVNLFVSLIYESFSYVYQRSSGLSVISREEIRRFKQAWAEYDPNGTGYITRTAFPRLLGELSGVFEMRIYDGDFSVRRLIEDCREPSRVSELPVSGHEPAPEIDIRKLNARLAELPVTEIRRRRQRMNTFYEEVLVSSDPDKGIAFTSLLMILAHYKVINDNKSLRLEEFLRRRARLQRVDEAVRRNVVIGFFDTLYWSRRFRRAMEQKKSGRMTMVPQFTVPEIFVDDEDITTAERRQRSPGASPLFSPVDLSPMDNSEWRASGTDIRSPSPPMTDMTLRSRANSVQATPQHSPTRSQSHMSPARHSPQMSPFSPPGEGPEWQFASALSRPPSPLETGLTEPAPSNNRSRQNSSVSAADVLEVLDNSAWGESIRRSFTMRRPSGGPR